MEGAPSPTSRQRSCCLMRIYALQKSSPKTGRFPSASDVIGEGIAPMRLEEEVEDRPA
ncbi:hypothetical protein RGR602_CH00942 [Rhizobium gallicum bv. gallicum R602sp]|uniref:Uncharacterized protein n=1 Tax=Rhizobium gallicum bv. gallicum R602sp TaxID=1041138 RepID=A0A0B4X157_9HYPH|nr:hypothetical protein RGR602_CH00942 [Rhizobium gallicum bv. gallicum R602sp]